MKPIYNPYAAESKKTYTTQSEYKKSRHSRADIDEWYSRQHSREEIFGLVEFYAEATK